MLAMARACRPLRRACVWLLSLTAAAATAGETAASRATQTLPAARPALVLLHGLTNKHPWSDDFLAECVRNWGQGRVYLVYTNTRPEERRRVALRPVRGQTLVVSGVDNPSAGDQSVVVQSQYLDESVRRLQAGHGLPKRFAIIAHSMGGLVARDYIDAHSGTVVGLVTLGTPHHGSPLALDFRWAGLFMGASAALADLVPARCDAFNARHPAATARLAAGGRIFTIRGDADASNAFGAYGELRLGWQILFERHHLDSDGLVPAASALLDGAVHLADFDDLDHYQLVRDARVARKASDALP